MVDELGVLRALSSAMTWRPIAFSAGALAIAAVAWWLAPMLLVLAGLGDLGVLGRVCLTVLALSGLEFAPRRLPGWDHDE